MKNKTIGNTNLTIEDIIKMANEAYRKVSEAYPEEFKDDKKLEAIKEKYSRIDRVNLYSGEVITGAIIERGETYTIVTTSGTIKVSRKDIQSNEIIKW